MTATPPRPRPDRPTRGSTLVGAACLLAMGISAVMFRPTQTAATSATPTIGEGTSTMHTEPTQRPDQENASARPSADSSTTATIEAVPPTTAAPSSAAGTRPVPTTAAQTVPPTTEAEPRPSTSLATSTTPTSNAPTTTASEEVATTVTTAASPTAPVPSTEQPHSTAASSGSGPTVGPPRVRVGELDVDDVIDDMSGRHEALMHGVPVSWSWAQHPDAVREYPADFTAFMAWGQVYETTAGDATTNVRVELKNMRAWALLRSTGTWVVLQDVLTVEGDAFREDFAGNVAIAADQRTEPGGGLSVIPGDGYNFHFWPTGGRAPLDSGDLVGVVVALDTRLVLEDPTAIDDRASAEFLVGVGADLWIDAVASHDPHRTIVGIGLGKMHRPDNDWQTVTMSTVDDATLRSNPPPLG